MLAARNAAYGVAMAPNLADRSLGGDCSPPRSSSTSRPPSPRPSRGAERGSRPSGSRGSPCSCAGTWARCSGRVGDAVGDPEALGLDAAFPAGFVALAVPHLRNTRGRVAAACGAVIALALVPLAPAGLPILAAALGVIPAVLFTPPPDDDTVPLSGPWRRCERPRVWQFPPTGTDLRGAP